MNFQDINTWKNHLVNGTSPELTDKLTKAAKSMEQLLIPLQWTSTAQPLTAKVRTDTNGVYVVDTFVSVLDQDHAGARQLAVHRDVQHHHRQQQRLADHRRRGIGAVVGAK